MKKEATLNSIFTQQEVLISCSSLQNLDQRQLIIQDEETQSYLPETSLDLLLTNFQLQINQHAKKMTDHIKKQFPTLSKAQLITEAFLNRRYRRGKREDNNPVMISEMVNKRVRQNLPIQLTISLFPCKIPNRLKAAGPLPDLAEIASLARFGELGQVIANLYEPGVEIIVLTDGQRFKNILHFPNEMLDSYQNKLKQITDALGVSAYVKILEYISFLETHLSSEKIAEKKFEYERLSNEYSSLVGSEFNLDNPLAYLHELQKPSSPEIITKIVQLFSSLIYSNYIKEIQESDRGDLITNKVYENIYDLSHHDSEVVFLRKKILAETWEATRKYVAEIASGRVVKPVETVFPESIRCDMHNIPDRLTLYSVDRSTPLTAFHGTGFVDKELRSSVRFRVSLQKEGFSPVYGNLLGSVYESQPIFYAPDSTFINNSLEENIIQKICLR